MDKLSQWLSVIANLGVIAGLVLLAYEIRLNTEASHAQTRETILAATQAELQAVRQDPNLIHSIVKEEALTEDEQIKLYTWLVSALRVREFSWLQWRSGIIDDAQWGSELAVTVAILQAPRVQLWWNRVGHRTVSKEFAAFINQNLKGIESSNGIYADQMRWANE